MHLMVKRARESHCNKHIRDHDEKKKKCMNENGVLN